MHKTTYLGVELVECEPHICGSRPIVNTCALRLEFPVLNELLNKCVFFLLSEVLQILVVLDHLSEIFEFVFIAIIASYRWAKISDVLHLNDIV